MKVILLFNLFTWVPLCPSVVVSINKHKQLQFIDFFVDILITVTVTFYNTFVMWKKYVGMKTSNIC